MHEEKNSYQTMPHYAKSLQLLIENARDYAIVMMDTQGRIVLWNTGAENVMGWQEAEIIAQPAAVFFTPEDQAKGIPEQEFRIAHEQGRAEDVRWHMRKDGSRFWGSGLVQPIHDDDGVLQGYSKIFRDLTVQKQAEETVRAERERLQATLDAAEVGTWLVDAASNRVIGDATLRGFFGLTEQEAATATTETYLSRIHLDDAPSVAAALHHSMTTGVKFDVTYRVPQPDDTVRWLEVRGQAAFNAEGQFIHLYGAGTDVTARKEAEHAREQAQAQAEHDRSLLDAVLDALPAGMIIADPVGKILHVNAACERIWGGRVDAPDVAGYRDYVGYWHDTGKRIEPQEWAMARALQGELCPGDLIAIERLDGSGRTIVVNSAAPVRGVGGEIIGGVVAEVDVSAQIRAEDALRESEQKFRLVADTMPQLVWSTLPDGFHDYYNARWFEYTGLTLEETQGTKWNDVVHPDDQARAWDVWRHSLATGDPYEIEYRFKRTDGAYRWFIGRALPLRDEQGSITRWFGTCTDVDDQKRTEETLRRQQHEIEALNARLARSMQETHHRVKNNLQVIAALVEMQTDELGNGSAVLRIKQHVRALAAIHDLLTQQAKRDTDTSIVSAEDVLQHLIPMLQATSGDRRIKAEIANVMLPVQKATALSLLVSECVSNAVKHARGEVEITLDVEGDTARLEICDDGIGFPGNFDPRKAAHTGLELIDSTARWDLRGEVMYENRDQGGGRVVVTFPLDVPSEP